MKLDVKKIVSYLKKQKFVVSAYLYGSYAKKKESASSDVDLALLTSLPKEPAIKKFENRMRLAGELSLVAGKEMDIVFLEEGGELLNYEIIKTGKLIYEKNPKKHRFFVAEAVIKYFDFLPLLKIMQTGLARAIKEGR